jgi:hypothetical protein
MANEKYILSPADGIIVDLSLIREVKDFSSHKIKGLQCDKIDFSANIDSIVCGWLKISIYLSTFDRHSVYSPGTGWVKKIYEIGEKKKSISMIDFFNFVKYYYLGICPKLKNTIDNYSLLYDFGDRLKVVVISDKFVGSMDNLVSAGFLYPQLSRLCKINRGSQVDLFYCFSENETLRDLLVRHGDKLKIGDRLIRRHDV